jgi:uncharacterized membrane protein
MIDLVSALTLLTAIGCGLIGGVFYAFSSFVMRGLARIPPAQGIAAMQSINVTVLNPWFLIPFVGTAAASVLLAVISLLRWGEPGALWRLAGSALYFFGTFVVTRAFNVPLNDDLEAVDATSEAGATRWARYVPTWTAWNTLRTATAIGAAVCLIIALVARRAA